jgi:hypothetical protein
VSHSTAQVSPHEFLQAVVYASNKRFLIDRQGDPVDFLAWFLHELHRCVPVLCASACGSKPLATSFAAIWGARSSQAAAASIKHSRHGPCARFVIHSPCAVTVAAA